MQIHRNYVESRRAIKHVQFDLYSHLLTINIRNPEFRNLNGITSLIESAMGNAQNCDMLFNSPSLSFLPLFKDVGMWKDLASGKYEKCYDQFANYDLLRENEANIGTMWANKCYLNFLMSSENKNVAPIQLGISKELCQFIEDLTPIEANNIANFAYPIFKFRFDDSFFKFADVFSRNREFVLARYFHCLMATCPHKISDFTHEYTEVFYRGEDAYPMIKVLIQLRMRASVIGALFSNLPMARIRQLFKAVYGLRSISGMKPVKTEYFFSNEVMRTHSTLLRFLFNLSHDSLNEYIPAMIYAYLAYKDMCDNTLLPIDRLPLLLHSSNSQSSDMSCRRCKICGTPYLVSTSANLYESDSYHCIACTEEKEIHKRIKTLTPDEEESEEQQAE